MGRTSSAFAVRSLLAITLVAAALAPHTSRHEGAAVKTTDQTTSEQPSPSPIVMAQGRCFNGRCF
jgi:hypothetical protein